MPANTLPPVSPTPTALVPTPVPGASAAAAEAGSFSRLLEAADARALQADPRAAAATLRPPGLGPAQKAPARELAKEAPREGLRSGTAPSPRAEASEAAGTEGARAAVEGERAEGAEESEETPAEGAPGDAAGLLAGLGLLAAARMPLEGAALRARGAAGRGGREGAEGTAAGALGTGGRAIEGLLQAAAADEGVGAGAGAAPGAASLPGFAGLLAAAPGAEARTTEAGLAAAALVAAPAAAAAGGAETSTATDLGALGGLLPAGAPTAAVPGHSAAQPAEGRLPATPGSPAFAQQLGLQISTYVREGVQHARLQLNPQELGPVTVQIQLQGGSAHLSFAAEHAQTRQALEQALPTLASQLRESGLTLSGGGVFEQAPQQQPQPQPGRRDGDDRREGSGRALAGSDGHGSGRIEGRPSDTGGLVRRRGVVDLVA